MESPIPENEVNRLRALKLYRIIDTTAEQSFDDLARLAATICDTPIALISVIDEDRLWFKSSFGLSASQAPRDMAFCAHTIMQDDVFIVEDAQADSRFVDHPLVVSGPLVRFYAGVPLAVTKGIALGTVCVIDRKPRKLTPQQIDALTLVRGAVVAQLELRRSLEDFRSVERLLPICAWCRSVEGANGKWTPLYEYLANTVPLSHSICPNCHGDVRLSMGKTTGLTQSPGEQE